jgi:hypothetical protein
MVCGGVSYACSLFDGGHAWPEYVNSPLIEFIVANSAADIATAPSATPVASAAPTAGLTPTVISSAVASSTHASTAVMIMMTVALLSVKCDVFGAATSPW